MVRWFPALFALALALPLAAETTVYRGTGASGEVVFSDRAMDGATRVAVEAPQPAAAPPTAGDERWRDMLAVAAELERARLERERLRLERERIAAAARERARIRDATPRADDGRAIWYPVHGHPHPHPHRPPPNEPVKPPPERPDDGVQQRYRVRWPQ